MKRVFGEPYERDGITIIPAAKIQGAGGGGGGEAKSRMKVRRVEARKGR